MSTTTSTTPMTMPGSRTLQRQLQKENVTKLVRAVRMLNIATACVQLLAGLGSLTEVFFLDVAGSLIAVYAILFALMLLCFECRLSVTEDVLRPNFGFLFGYRGMASFLVFIGLLDFGMVGHFFGVVAGGMACANALIVLFVGICAPRALAEAPMVINPKLLPTYGSSSEIQGPIALALAAGAREQRKSAVAV